MKVRVISGRHKGLTGDMKGFLDQRRMALGSDGKVMVTLDKPNARPEFIRLKHLSEDNDLFSKQIADKVQS